MKKVYLPAMALACAMGLAACGGGNELVLSISSIAGLTAEGLSVSNNGGAAIPIGKDEKFKVIDSHFGSDTAFNIVIVPEHQPPNATCTIYNGKGTTGAYAPNNISIVCIATPHDVSATVSGLKATSTGMVVVNGATQYSIDPKADGSTFVYPFTKTIDGTTTHVGDGSTYGFGILTQPTGQNCTLANGAGTMGNHDVTNLTITCV